MMLREIYEYSKELQKYDSIGGLVSIGVFFCTKTFYILFSSWVRYWVLAFPQSMKWLLLCSIAWSTSLIVMMVVRYLIQGLESSSQRKRLISSTFLRLSCFLLFPFELSIYGIKSIIVITYSSSQEYRRLFAADDDSSGVVYYLVMIAVYTDFLISVIICYMKSTVLRSLIPDGGFFSKNDGAFEYFFILLIPIKHLFFYLSNMHDRVTVDGVERANGPNMVFFSIEILLMIIIGGIYFKELPYYNPMSERVMCHFLLSTSFIFGLFGLSGSDLNKTLQIYIFIIPLQLACLELFLKFSYRLDFMNSKQTKSWKCLKIVMNHDSASSSDLFEKTYSQGVFMNYIKQKKVLSRNDIDMWKDVQLFLKDNNSADAFKHLEEEDSDDSDASKLIEANEAARDDCIQSSSDINGANQHKQQSIDAAWQSEPDPQSEVKGSYEVTKKLNHIIVNGYTDSNPRSSSARLIRIHWLLCNRVIIFSIFADLHHLLDLANNLKTRFIYYYALKEVECYLTKLYTNPEIINLQSIRLFDGLQQSTNTRKRSEGNLDIARAFYQKYTIEHLKRLVSGFSAQSAKHLEEMETNTTSYSRIFSSVEQLHSKDQAVQKVFEKYHNISQAAEKQHLLPYCLHACFNVNRYRTSKTILSEYLKRCMLLVKLLQEKNPQFLPEHILIDCVVFLLDSAPASLGTILEVFGESEKLLNVTTKDLIGKGPNCLLPESISMFHEQMMTQYLSNPPKHFLGVQRDSFIKMPETNFIQSASLVIKISPKAEGNFRFLVGIKPNQKKYNQKIILGPRCKIDCFSTNFLTLMDSSYLQPRVPIAQLSTELYGFIREVSRDIDAQCVDMAGKRDRDRLVKSFNRNAAREAKRARSHLRKQQERNHDQSSVDSLSIDCIGRSREKQSNIFELKFSSSGRSAPTVKVFEVNLEVRDFKGVNKKLAYLDLTPVDDNDHKISMVRRPKSDQQKEPGTLNDISLLASKNVNINNESAKIRISLTHPQPQEQVEATPEKTNVIEEKSPRRSHDSLDSIQGDIVDYKDDLIDEFFIEKQTVTLRDHHLTTRQLSIPAFSTARKFKFLKPQAADCFQEEYRVPNKIHTEDDVDRLNRKKKASVLLNSLGVGIVKGIMTRQFIKQLKVKKEQRKLRENKDLSDDPSSQMKMKADTSRSRSRSPNSGQIPIDAQFDKMNEEHGKENPSNEKHRKMETGGTFESLRTKITESRQKTADTKRVSGGWRGAALQEDSSIDDWLAARDGERQTQRLSLLKCDP